MYDSLTIAAFADELNATIVDGRIQQILQVDPLTIALEVYAQRRRRWLVMSAHPEQARVLLSDQRVDGDAERVTPLQLLLRKYARGGRIVAVSQPRYERILRVSIAKPQYPDNTDDDDEQARDPIDITYSELYVELMGRRSNVILTSDSGRILDAVKRVTPDMSRVRPIRPGAAYVPPPPQDKANPLAVRPEELLASAHASSESVVRWLVGTLLGISPVLAREVAARAGTDADAPAAQLDAEAVSAIARALGDVFEPLVSGRWEPVTYSDAAGRVTFSPIRLRFREADPEVTVQPFPTLSEAAAVALASAPLAGAGSGRHAQRRERLLAEIDEARARVASRLHSLREQAERAAEVETWRAMGEAIYAHFSEIEPGQRELRTEDGLSIALDPALSASQNAQEYFERYRKAQSAEEHIPSLVDAAERDLAWLDQLRALAQLAENYDEIEAIRLEWLEWATSTPGAPKAARPKGARPAASARRPRAFATPAGDRIWVGRTSRQNEQVTFDVAGPDDLWLHARNMPGAHVILRASGEPRDDALEAAAALAAWYSDGRNATAVPVDITQRRHVRKIRGAGPGMVTYRNERTVNVRPRSERDLGLTGGDGTRASG